MTPTAATRARAAGIDRRQLRRHAVADIAAVSAGVVPFGIFLGLTVIVTGTGPLAGVLGAALVYGGSAQLTTITVLHVGSSFLAAIASGIVVNSRVLLYGAALEPWFRAQPRWFRLVAPAFIQDQTYLSTLARPAYRGEEFRRYWWWLGSTLLLVWTGSVVLGMLIGPALPELPHLGLVGTGLFLAMLMPRLLTSADGAAALGAAITALLVHALVPALAILAGAAVGVGCAVAVRPSPERES